MYAFTVVNVLDPTATILTPSATTPLPTPTLLPGIVQCSVIFIALYNW